MAHIVFATVHHHHVPEIVAVPCHNGRVPTCADKGPFTHGLQCGHGHAWVPSSFPSRLVAASKVVKGEEQHRDTTERQAVRNPPPIVQAQAPNQSQHGGSQRIAPHRQLNQGRAPRPFALGRTTHQRDHQEGQRCDGQRGSVGLETLKRHHEDLKTNGKQRPRKQKQGRAVRRCRTVGTPYAVGVGTVGHDARRQTGFINLSEGPLTPHQRGASSRGCGRRTPRPRAARAS